MPRRSARNADSVGSIVIAAIHTSCGVLSLIAGSCVCVTPKGTKRHVLLGRLYCLCIVTLNVSAFGIYTLFGAFGVFHVCAIVSLLTVGAGLAPVLMKPRFKNWLQTHYQFMAWSYAGLLAATSKEAFVHIRPLQRLARATTPFFPLIVMFVILIVSAIVISRLQAGALSKYGRRAIAILVRACSRLMQP
jgi:uncharacterized membrane protein